MKRQVVAFDKDGHKYTGVYDTEDIAVNVDGSYSITVVDPKLSDAHDHVLVSSWLDSQPRIHL